MPKEIREFSVGALLSLTTDKMLADRFSEVHEAAEFVLGHPIWTHEFGRREVWQRLRENVLEQVPVLASFDGSGVVDKESAKEFLDEAVQVIGVRSFSIVKGTCVREQSPIETLQEMMPEKPIIVVDHPKGDSDAKPFER
jgi:hypothetical protein